MRKGKERIKAALISALVLCVCAAAVPARADILPEEDPGIYATYTEKGKWESNFGELSDVMDQTISQMQPGDEAVFKVSCKNEYEEITKWYMENNVLYSLEDRSKNKATYGGAYSYILTYEGPGVSRTLFESDTIGGEDRDGGVGLNEATIDLGEWLYLGDLAKGESGLVELHVLLEGETQGNNYQDTLADLEMRFSVETTGAVTPPPTKTPTPTKTPPRKTVPTGDRNNLWLYVVIAAAAAVCLILFACVNIRNRKKAEAALMAEEEEIRAKEAQKKAGQKKTEPEKAGKEQSDGKGEEE